MITWNGFFFHNPSRHVLELVLVLHDYIILFLVSILIVVLINIFFSFFFNYFSLNFFENHQLERVWTMVPFFLLIFILVPSLISLYTLDRCLYCGLTFRIMGHQWYWSYFSKDASNLSFDSYILSSETRKIRLLEVDNRLVVPTRVPLRFLVSSSDVIHSWTVPSMGVKMDAIPGRINQFCFSPKRRGVFFGQCSEICGTNHRFMPVVVESVPYEEFFNSI